MRSFKRRISESCSAVTTLIALLLTLLSPMALAWDALGHRLTAYVAWDQLSDTEQQYWINVLSAHPRFQQDFIAAMPVEIAGGAIAEQQRWQFGQAAIWPDIARGFSEMERRLYDFPNRHWIDGTWVRDDVPLQGNIYLDMAPLPDFPAPADAEITRHSQAGNVLTGLLYARYAMEHERDPAQRAIALSWLLHLIGDIHQPLHTGALFSPGLFPDGDRGGNGTRVNGSNLHAVWDQALRGPSLTQNLRELTAIRRDLHAEQSTFAPGSWLQQSREILHAVVYPPTVIANITRSENTGNQLGSVTLSDDYRAEMRAIALQRVAEAGFRIQNVLQSLAP